MVDIEMEFHTCSCGITWGAPKEFFEKRRADHKTFFCPNGCRRHYPPPAESIEDRPRRVLSGTESSLQYWKTRAKTVERSRAGYKAHFRRLKNMMEGNADE